MLVSAKRFLKRFNSIKAIVLAFAMITPILLCNYFFLDLRIGFSIALGVLFCSPADVPGGLKHKFFGILSAVLLSFLVTLLIGFVSNSIWVITPVLGVFVFIISYIAVFGFRASLVSFAGLLAIVLSFAYNSTEISVITYALLVALGGLWYLSISMLISFLLPEIQTDQLFAETIEKIATFLKIRGKLLVCTTNRNKLYIKMYALQTEINENYESIRDIILSERRNSGFSNRTRRQQLFFSELVDILELAVANPVNYEAFDSTFKKHKEKVKEFKNLIFEIAYQLEHISRVIRKEESLKPNPIIFETISKIESHIDFYKTSVDVPKYNVGTLMLLNFKDYQEKQIQKITGLERILNNYMHNSKILSFKKTEQFIKSKDYDFKKVKANFSFKSPIFKHSLRLAIIVVIGFLIGNMLSMQKSYWILLTLVVIMRPSYGLTKERSKNRAVGTLIGAAIATVIILLTQNTIVYAVISIVSLPIAFSLIQLNYRNAAIFITLNIVFVYAIVEPNILLLIKFRVLDTLIGVSLAFAANYFLFPAWQFQNIREYFIEAIKSNKFFLKQIAADYSKKENISATYKSSRKDAFLNIGNLNAAFQRMNQDPKSKQKEFGTIYEITTIINTFLSSLTALGMFIRNSKTEMPLQFKELIEPVFSNLNLAIQLLKNDTILSKVAYSNIENSQKLYDNYLVNLSNQYDKEEKEGKEITATMKLQLKEIQLVSEQIKWLFNLSEKLTKSVKKIHV